MFSSSVRTYSRRPARGHLGALRSWSRTGGSYPTIVASLQSDSPWCDPTPLPAGRIQPPAYLPHDQEDPGHEQHHAQYAGDADRLLRRPNAPRRSSAMAAAQGWPAIVEGHAPAPSSRTVTRAVVTYAAPSAPPIRLYQLRSRTWP